MWLSILKDEVNPNNSQKLENYLKSKNVTSIPKQQPNTSDSTASPAFEVNLSTEGVHAQKSITNHASNIRMSLRAESESDSFELPGVTVTGDRYHEDHDHGDHNNDSQDIAALDQQIDWNSPFLQDANKSSIFAAKNYMEKLNHNLPDNFWGNTGRNAAVSFAVGFAQNFSSTKNWMQAAVAGAKAATGTVAIGSVNILNDAVDKTNKEENARKSEQLEGSMDNRGHGN